MKEKLKKPGPVSSSMERDYRDAKNDFKLMVIWARLSINGIVLGAAMFAAAMVLSIVGDALHINPKTPVIWLAVTGPILILIASICVTESFRRRKRARVVVRSAQWEWETHQELLAKAQAEGAGNQSITSPWRLMEDAPRDGTLIYGIFPDASIVSIYWGMSTGDAGWMEGRLSSALMEEQPVLWQPVVDASTTKKDEL
jgi:hypothetical protein